MPTCFILPFFYGIQKRADGLGGLEKINVIFCDHKVANQRHHLTLYIVTLQNLVEDLLKHGAYLSLSHCHTDVEGLLRDSRHGFLLL